MIHHLNEDGIHRAFYWHVDLSFLARIVEIARGSRNEWGCLDFGLAELAWSQSELLRERACKAVVRVEEKIERNLDYPGRGRLETFSSVREPTQSDVFERCLAGVLLEQPHGVPGRVTRTLSEIGESDRLGEVGFDIVLHALNGLLGLPAVHWQHHPAPGGSPDLDRCCDSSSHDENRPRARAGMPFPTLTVSPPDWRASSGRTAAKLPARARRL